MTYDFMQYDPVADSLAGAWLHLKDPYDPAALLYADAEKTLPVRLKVYGPETDQVKAFNDAVMRIMRNPEVEFPDEEDAKLCADMVLGWENMGIGEDTSFSEANAMTLMLKHKSIRKQVANFAQQLKNFKGSANAS